jgi:hypothetical protein
MRKIGANVTEQVKQLVQHDLQEQAAGDHWVTNLLAQRSGVGRDRFRMGGRQWLLRWRFQPTENIDALRLLETAAPNIYTIGSEQGCEFWLRVEIVGIVREAHPASKSKAIMFTIPRAIGIDVELPE